MSKEWNWSQIDLTELNCDKTKEQSFQGMFIELQSRLHCLYPCIGRIFILLCGGSHVDNL